MTSPEGPIEEGGVGDTEAGRDADVEDEDEDVEVVGQSLNSIRLVVLRAETCR